MVSPRTPPWPSVTLLLMLLLPPVAVAVGAVFFGIPVPTMTRDIAGVANVHPLTGFLSSLSVLMWCSGATVWLFSCMVLGARGEAYRFHLQSSALMAYLGLDDLFEFHEVIAPGMLHVPEGVVMALIASAAALYVWLWRGQLLRRDALLFGLALFSLAASMGADTVLEHLLQQRLGHWEYFVEDSLKWAGVCFWVAFAMKRCNSDLLRSAPSTAP